MLRRTTLNRPLERLLTARAQQALDLAKQEAKTLGHDRVTADHLLMGLARLDEGVAITTLRSLGCDLTTRVQETGVDLDHVVELARREAAGLKHRYIGTEHLLLGLLREERTAADLGVDLGQTRAQVIKVLHGKAALTRYSDSRPLDSEPGPLDSVHIKTEIGFGVTRLLGFDLLPRIKQINKVKPYRIESGESELYPRLTPALTRPIRWDLIEQNYDQMIKYATAIKQGTASTEAILRRFTESASHSTYQAMLEVGRAQKTILVARYLGLRELQREIQEGLNVVESSNGANSVIFYGKGGDIATNRREHLEMSVLCLRILQAALVYINTLMLQEVLADLERAELLKPADQRGLTPLFWQHIQPYGEVRLDVAKRLSLGGAARAGDSRAGLGKSYKELRVLRGMDFEMATCVETTLPTHPLLTFPERETGVPASPPAEVAGRPGGLTAAVQGCMVTYTCS